MRITAYWKVVLKRFVDSMGLHLLRSVQNLVNRDMEIEVVNEFMGLHNGGIERILEESPAVAKKRERLYKSIKLLKDSNDVVAEIMDRITVEDYAECLFLCFRILFGFMFSVSLFVFRN
ncbi:hypothetical protein RHMOL_Rhmol07G0130100 [Rhododendron molle]|uniref:Uncharacterized protein n=1 Tax=Rhododendron molle TaxID=49168 RepID=A0ACC0N1Z6_RHOML|nr:hypothetical protein RHMOL_Rhmol07G0130100 [Rhododendron molle]